MKKSVLIAIAFAVIAGGLIGLYMFNKKVPTLDDAKADYELTADELYNAFDSDETAALAKYQDKIIAVSGTVFRTKVDTGQLNVILKASQSMTGGVNGSIRDKSMTVPDKGENVVIKGQCTGYLMDVVLSNCVLVRK